MADEPGDSGHAGGHSGGVFASTLATAKAHPYWIVGGVAALVAVLWLLSAKRAKTGQSFQFSYGPSDAQIKAGTALAIGQAADQTAVTMATLQAHTNTTVAQDYFGYLATANANGLSAAKLNTDAATKIAGIQSTTALGTAGYSANVALHGQDTALAGTLHGQDTALMAKQIDAATIVAQAGDAVMMNESNNITAARISTSKDFTSGVLATIAAGSRGFGG